jgi:hypothetical protein
MSCGSGIRFVKTLGGKPGTTSIVWVAVEPYGQDFVNGHITLDGGEVELRDYQISFDGTFAIDGTTLYRLQEQNGGEWTASVVGAAAGLTALGGNGPTIYGAAGLDLEQVDTTPLKRTVLGTVNAPGCTRIIDLWGNNAGSYLTFGLLLECGAGGVGYARATLDTFQPSSLVTSTVETTPLSHQASGLTSGDIAVAPQLFQRSTNLPASWSSLRDLDTTCIGPFPLRGSTSN